MHRLMGENLADGHEVRHMERRWSKNGEVGARQNLSQLLSIALS